MYYTVYAPDGEMFEVTRSKFEKLVLQDNWTQSPPIVVDEKEAPKPEPARFSRKTRTRNTVKIDE